MRPVAILAALAVLQAYCILLANASFTTKTGNPKKSKGKASKVDSSSSSCRSLPSNKQQVSSALGWKSVAGGSRDRQYKFFVEKERPHDPHRNRMRENI